MTGLVSTVLLTEISVPSVMRTVSSSVLLSSSGSTVAESTLAELVIGPVVEFVAFTRKLKIELSPKVSVGPSQVTSCPVASQSQSLSWSAGGSASSATKLKPVGSVSLRVGLEAVNGPLLVTSNSNLTIPPPATLPGIAVLRMSSRSALCSISVLLISLLLLPFESLSAVVSAVTRYVPGIADAVYVKLIVRLLLKTSGSLQAHTTLSPGCSRLGTLPLYPQSGSSADANENPSGTVISNLGLTTGSSASLFFTTII